MLLRPDNTHTPGFSLIKTLMHSRKKVYLSFIVRT